MAPFSQFVNRLANYIANEVLIKGLANSRMFQRFAVRTDKSLTDLHKTGTETFQKTVEEFSTKAFADGLSGAAAAATKGPPRPPPGGFRGFASAFVREVRKDLGM